MDAEWQLDAFEAELAPRSPSPEYTPRSLSNSPISVTSVDSRSSTAEPEASPPSPKKTQVPPRPSETARHSSTSRQPWTEPTVVHSSNDTLPMTATTQNFYGTERSRVAAVLKSIGVMQDDGEPSNNQIQEHDMQLVLLEQQKKKRALMAAREAVRANLPLPNVSPIAGAPTCSDASNPQGEGNNSLSSEKRDGPQPFRSCPPLAKSPDFGDRLPAPEPRSLHARNSSHRVLDACELDLHLLDARKRKMQSEERLETFKTSQLRSNNIIQLQSPESEPEGLVRSFQKSQRLFAVAQAQIQQQLGMDLSNEEKELVKLNRGSDADTEQQIRDNIFIEGVKVELLTLQISQTKNMIKRNEGQNPTLKDNESNTAQVSMTDTNATALHFAGPARPSTKAELEQMNKRKEEREKRSDEADALPHKPVQPAGPSSSTSRESARLPPPPSGHQGPLPPLRMGLPAHERSMPPSSIRSSGMNRPGQLPQPFGSHTFPPPPPPPGFHRCPPPPPRPGQCVLPGPPPGIRPGVPPPPPGSRICPPPPPNWPPGGLPRPSYSGQCPPPFPKPTSSNASPLNLNSNTKSTHTTPAGVSVKTFTSVDGSTSTTMTTNPEFEVGNGIEIVTKTTKNWNAVTTTTTTTLIPLMGNEKRLNKWVGNSKGKERAQTEDDSGDESDSSGSRIICDD